MVYAEFGGQTECIMGNSKIENWSCKSSFGLNEVAVTPLSRLREFKKLVNNS